MLFGIGWTGSDEPMHAEAKETNEMTVEMPDLHFSPRENRYKWRKETGFGGRGSPLSTARWSGP